MTNSDIADILKLYADLSELHGGDPFKIKTYAANSFRIDKLPTPLFGKSVEELKTIEGVGKSIAAKIYQLCATGSFDELTELLAATPDGVRDIMRVKGLGPKKVAHIWKELGIDSIGELLYACRENRLAQAKGFGLKTQQNVIKQIEFIFASADKFHYAKAEEHAIALVEKLKTVLRKQVSLCGAIRRKMEVLEQIELVAGVEDLQEASAKISTQNILTDTTIENHIVKGKIENYPVTIFLVNTNDFAYQLFLKTGSEAHVEQFSVRSSQFSVYASQLSEEEIYKAANLQFIEPEMREGLGEIEKAKNNTLPKLIEFADLRGPLHNHSTWSDGLNTVEEMAKFCIAKGYEYLGMADHSKAAFYAKGMDEDKVFSQQKEIDGLNNKHAPFRIFKGIECDILFDGSLDYNKDVLATFDYVVASVHSNLKMNEEKAMLRLLRAIENPFTTILGHPTGRLLLMREGYPVDHKKMIDACAANGVVIEINANPYRLDLDWRWIDYALNKSVMLSINPDAHDTEGFYDMYFGTQVARKGGLTKDMCLNAMNRDEIAAYFLKRKPM